MIWQAVIGAFTSWNDNRVKVKEAKVNAKIAKINAQAARDQRKIDVEADWDLEALRQSKDSWKDEWLLFIWTYPLIASFIPGLQENVVKGWHYVSQAPVWYQVGLLGMVAASFGLRWWFNKNKLTVATPDAFD